MFFLIFLIFLELDQVPHPTIHVIKLNLFSLLSSLYTVGLNLLIQSIYSLRTQPLQNLVLHIVCGVNTYHFL